MISRVSRSDSRTMICRNCARSSGSRSGVSSRISENERIEVNGVRSSWLTVARKSSFSWSSWRSRSFASRSSAVACSSASDFCSSRWLYSITCEVSSRIRIRSSGPITSPRTTEPIITRALAEPIARASWRSASWTRVASAAASGASTRPRRRRSAANTLSARGLAQEADQEPAQRRDLRLAAPELADAGRAGRRRRTAPPAAARDCPGGRGGRSRTRSVMLRPRLQTTAWLTGAQPVEAEQRLRAQQADAQRAVVDEAGVDQAGRRQRRQDQRVEPDRDAAEQAQHGAGEIGLLPVEAGHDRRRELGHGTERDQPDADQREILADPPEEDVAQQQEQQDAEPADHQDQPRQIGPLGQAQERQAQQDRHDQIVGDHRAERHRGDDDHGRRGRQAAQIGDQGQPLLPRGDRQQQHVQIALAGPGDHAGQARSAGRTG